MQLREMLRQHRREHHPSTPRRPGLLLRVAGIELLSHTHTVRGEPGHRTCRGRVQQLQHPLLIHITDLTSQPGAGIDDRPRPVLPDRGVLDTSERGREALVQQIRIRQVSLRTKPGHAPHQRDLRRNRTDRHVIHRPLTRRHRRPLPPSTESTLTLRDRDPHQLRRRPHPGRLRHTSSPLRSLNVSQQHTRPLLFLLGGDTRPADASMTYPDRPTDHRHSTRTAGSARIAPRRDDLSLVRGTLSGSACRCRCCVGRSPHPPDTKKDPTFRSGPSSFSCPNREKTVSSFVTLKSLISRGSSEGQGVSVSSLAVPRSDVRGPVVTPIETAGTPVAPETLQAMVAAYESRASLISIAREHRLGKETVRDLLVDAGVRIRRQGLDDEQVAHAVRGYESGLTTREIARELGIGHSMVWRALKRAEVESRPNTRRVGRKLSKQ